MKTLTIRNWFAAAAYVSALLLCTLGGIASAQVYTDRAAFQAALGTFSIETFESVPLIGTVSGGSVPSLTLPSFTVSATPTAVKVLGTPDGFGSYNTTPGGSRYLYLDTDIGFQGSVTTFQFVSPLTGFGFDYTGVSEPGTTFTASLAGQRFNLALNSGSANFWGFIGATPFSEVSLNSGIDSGYGIDQVTFAVVPEPSTLFLLGLGACSIACFVRRMQQRETRCQDSLTSR